MMGAYKRAVTQKARVEGSISTDYLGREITYLCSYYFKTLNLVSSFGLRNDPENESVQVVHCQYVRILVIQVGSVKVTVG